MAEDEGTKSTEIAEVPARPTTADRIIHTELTKRIVAERLGFSLDFQMGKLCEFMGSDRLTLREKEAACTVINWVLELPEDNLLTPDRLGSAKEQLVAAINARSPGDENKWTPFFRKIQAFFKRARENAEEHRREAAAENGGNASDASIQERRHPLETYSGDVPSPHQRAEFMRAINWQDPHTVDTIVEVYINRVTTLVHEELESSPALKSKRPRVSRGSPETERVELTEEQKLLPADERPAGEKLVRPNLRIRVYDQDVPEGYPDMEPAQRLATDPYILSYTPETRETDMSDKTKAFLDGVREHIREDLGIEIDPPRLHILTTTTTPTDGEVSHPGESDTHTEEHTQFSDSTDTDVSATIEDMHNASEPPASDADCNAHYLYEREGAIWDLELPAGEIHAKLRKIISGPEEFSPKHVPDWTIKTRLTTTGGHNVG